MPKKQNKKLAFQLFLAHLLMPLALAGWQHFFESSALDLIVGLAISKVELIGGEVAIG